MDKGVGCWIYQICIQLSQF